MKKFEIKNKDQNKWLVSHNEVPKFTCVFEDKKFNYQRTIAGLSNPTGDPKKVQLLLKMEQWLRRYNRRKGQDFRVIVAQIVNNSCIFVVRKSFDYFNIV